MNERPILDRPAVRLPAFAGSSDIWATLIELSAGGHPEWTLVGGQMVMLHAAEHSVPPLRVSRDIDVVVNARVVTAALRGFVSGITKSGFQLAGASPDGVAHRYTRGGASIDVLAPEGLGPRTDLTTTPPGRTIQAPGGTQALARTELVPVEHAGQRGLIPRPSLLGAVVMKAAAAAVDDAPQAHQQDLALLLSLVPDPGAMAAEMTRTDRVRLRGVAIGEPSHAVWELLPPEAADRARLAYRSLSSPPALRTQPRRSLRPDRPAGLSAGGKQTSARHEAVVCGERLGPQRSCRRKLSTKPCPAHPNSPGSITIKRKRRR